jgi:hypothetical protein
MAPMFIVFPEKPLTGTMLDSGNQISIRAQRKHRIVSGSD